MDQRSSQAIMKQPKRTQIEAQQQLKIPDICRGCKWLHLQLGQCTKGISPPCEKYEACSKCDPCGILVGPYRIETTLTPVGSMKLCGGCLVALKRNGFLHLGQDRFLLPGGTTCQLSSHERDQLFSTWGNLKTSLAKLSRKAGVSQA